MRAVFFAGALISLVPLLAFGVFNGLTIVGLLIVGLTTFYIIKKESA
ncbi:MAG: hypothetical protein JJE28_07065 [Actinomycetales bacterium]|nr:hypothetical protein [Actinomycetales bacterium]